MALRDLLRRLSSLKKMRKFDRISATSTMMTPAETEKALRDLFKQLRSPARAICHFPKPPQRKEVCGFSIYYKGALVREYYGKELIKEFKKTAKEKDLWAEA